MNNSITDINFQIFKHVQNIKDLQKICKLNKSYYNFCQDNKELICKYLLNKFQVKYTDPKNFIYIINRKNLKDYKINDQFKYASLFKLYMKYYYENQIDCENLNITSFPIYPNMTNFNGYDNALTSFPIQPNMTNFNGYDNALTSFPIQPNMTNFNGYDNALTSFPIQPNMTDFNGDDNALTSFSIQPKMTTFMVDTIN
jgi:hypothetical protein